MRVFVKRLLILCLVTLGSLVVVYNWKFNDVVAAQRSITGSRLQNSRSAYDNNAIVVKPEATKGADQPRNSQPLTDTNATAHVVKLPGNDHAVLKPVQQVVGLPQQIVKKAPTVRQGRFRGSPGQHAFYHQKTRDWYVDPKVVQQHCRQTNFTQCNPPPRRTDAEKQADRAAHKPYTVVDFRRFPWEPQGPHFEGCNYDNCRYGGSTVTPEADAVFIYGVGLIQNVPPPQVRLPHQVFIYGAWEPPTPFWLPELNNPNNKWNLYFNATMTYRIDSDIRYSYGKMDFQPREPSQLPDYRAIARGKSRTALWMLSNCVTTTSKRKDYIKEMQKYIDVDIFGKCGMPCDLQSENCVPDFSTTYRFYLAFENSFCTDYVTEKIFKVFIDGSHIIPVVRGATDYNREFPQKTFINAADFKGPKELALFLKALSEDEEEYSKYLETKDRYRAVADGNRWCYVCEYLHKRKDTDRKTVNLKKVLRDGHLMEPERFTKRD